MVDSDDSSKDKSKSNNVNQNCLKCDSAIPSISSDIPPSNTQIPGQFNYHPQLYKRISEDLIDKNDATTSTSSSPTTTATTTPLTNVLTCYKQSPPQLLTTADVDDPKKQQQQTKFQNGNGDLIKNSNQQLNHIIKADFEQAIELTGYGKFHYLLLAICGLVSTSEEMDVISMSFILPSAQCDLELNTQTKGWLNSIIFIGMMVGAYVWGSIADTLGRRKVLIVISFMNAVCIVASSFSQTYMLFMIFRFLNGVA